MSCSAFVRIEYSKELEDKIIKMNGVESIPGPTGETFGRFRVSADMFIQHKKEDDAHRWVTGNGNISTQYEPSRMPENCGWEYQSHGFEIWIGFEKDIVFIVPCHWNYDHGRFTLIDIRVWIKDNLGNINIKNERIS